MTFDSSVRISFHDKLIFSLDTEQLLQSVSPSPPAGVSVKTESDQFWQSVKEPVKKYDWTYEPDFPFLSSLLCSNETKGIDYELLGDTRQEIVFYDSIDFYEDELADNGIAKVLFKIRVMPWGFFALLRYFLRIDNTLYKCKDFRLFHEHQSPHLVTETRIMQAEFDPSYLGMSDDEAILQLPIKAMTSKAYLI